MKTTVLAPHGAKLTEAQAARSSAAADIEDVVQTPLREAPRPAVAASASVRRKRLLAKMAADRVTLQTGLAQQRGATPSPWLNNAQGEPYLTRAHATQFLSEHAFSVAAAALGILVLGPRQAIFAVARRVAPLMIAHGVKRMVNSASHGPPPAQSEDSAATD